MYYDNDLLEKKSLYLLKIRASISTEEKTILWKNTVISMKNSLIYVHGLVKFFFLTACDLEYSVWNCARKLDLAMLPEFLREVSPLFCNSQIFFPTLSLVFNFAYDRDSREETIRPLL